MYKVVLERSSLLNVTVNEGAILKSFEGRVGSASKIQLVRTKLLELEVT